MVVAGAVVVVVGDAVVVVVLLEVVEVLVTLSVQYHPYRELEL